MYNHSRLIGVFFLGSVAGWSCTNHDLCDFKIGPDFNCAERPDDPTGYLQPICQHIAENFSCYAMDPNKLEIAEITSGINETYCCEYCIEYCSVDYDFVWLSCCLTGDGAVIHVATKTVVEFWLGNY